MNWIYNDNTVTFQQSPPLSGVSVTRIVKASHVFFPADCLHHIAECSEGFYYFSITAGLYYCAQFIVVYCDCVVCFVEATLNLRLIVNELKMRLPVPCREY